MIYFCEFDDEEEEVEDCPAPPCPNPRNNNSKIFKKSFKNQFLAAK